MDWRTIFKNLWLAFTIFAFFAGGYFVSSQHYKQIIEVKERRQAQEISKIQAEADLKIEHFQREAAEKANQAILEHQHESRKRENEIYREMAALQRKFVDNRTLIKQLHDSQAGLCNRGLLDESTCNRQLRRCEELLSDGAALAGRSIEILQEQSVLSGAGK